jgi:hypothetical protein
LNIDIADRNDVHIRPPHRKGQMTFAAEAGADDGEADAVACLRRCFGGRGGSGEDPRVNGEASGGKGDVADEVAAGGGHSGSVLLLVKYRKWSGFFDYIYGNDCYARKPAKTTISNILVGILGVIPLIGAIVGFVLIILGIAAYRSWKLIVIGGDWYFVDCRVVRYVILYWIF